MKAVLQRVSKAQVEVDGRITGEIGSGWLVLLGVERGDGESDFSYILDKTLNLRGFSDKEGRMNHSVLQKKGDVLVVSQFTLLGNCQKGRRPSFSDAADPKEAERIYDRFCDEIERHTGSRQTGEFGVMMEVSLTNDGPVTFLLDSRCNSRSW